MASTWLANWRTRSAHRRRIAGAAAALYAEVVGQARTPHLYRDWGVPDTSDGRLEMIGLHALLVMRHLRGAGEEGVLIAQALFDVMFQDVDRSLREQGVGDLSIGKHVKRAAKTFLARYQMLDPALDAKDEDAVTAIITRNLLNGDEIRSVARFGELGRYLIRQDEVVGRGDRQALVEGRVTFAPVGIEQDSVTAEWHFKVG